MMKSDFLHLYLSTLPSELRLFKTAATEYTCTSWVSTLFPNLTAFSLMELLFDLAGFRVSHLRVSPGLKHCFIQLLLVPPLFEFYSFCLRWLSSRTDVGVSRGLHLWKWHHYCRYELFFKDCVGCDSDCLPIVSCNASPHKRVVSPNRKALCLPKISCDGTQHHLETDSLSGVSSCLKGTCEFKMSCSTWTDCLSKREWQDISNRWKTITFRLVPTLLSIMPPLLNGQIFRLSQYCFSSGFK